MQLSLDRRKLDMLLNLDRMIEKAPASVKDDILFQAMVKYYNKAVDDYWDLRGIYSHMERIQWFVRDNKTEAERNIKGSESYTLVMEELSTKVNKKQELVDFYAGLIKKKLNL